jgi:hypothetical protein
MSSSTIENMKDKPLTHKEVSSRGGKAKNAKLTDEQRKEIGRQLAKARKTKRAVQ